MELILKLQQTPEPETLGMKKIFNQQGGSIGRLPTCLWQLKDVFCRLSREHAKIYSQDNNFYLEDQSTNGVYINDSIMPIGRGNTYHLKLDDKIIMGDYHFQVESIIDNQCIPVNDNIPLLEDSPAQLFESSQILSPAMDSLSDLLTQEESVLNIDMTETNTLFATNTADIDAKTSDEFMAELTGNIDEIDPLNELINKPIVKKQEQDNYNINTDTAFNIPQVIPDGIDFMKEAVIEKTIIKKNKEQHTQVNVNNNTIPEDFIPDLTQLSEHSLITINNSPPLSYDKIEDSLIPEDYISVSNNNNIRFNKIIDQKIDYKNAINQLLHHLELDPLHYNSDSLQQLLQKIATMSKQYALEKGIDLSADTIIFEKGSNKK
jgi:pSer/pThr/pTyr-binding forkhead associated (FHA) protein